MWQIKFYQDSRGGSPVLDYLQSLPARDRAKANAVFTLLKEYGTALGKPHARHIQGPLWELRPGDNRLFYFLHTGRQFVILHGFRKKTMRTPEKEIRTAIRRMNEVMED
jgi:phage-related protein